MEELGKSENRTKHLCTIIRNLCKAAEASGRPNFTPIADGLINKLVTTCLNQNSSLQSLNDSMLAIMDLISVSKNQELCVNQINFVINNFSKLPEQGNWMAPFCIGVISVESSDYLFVFLN